MSNKCRNTVQINISVSELMDLRVVVGRLSSMIEDMGFLLHVLELLISNGRRINDLSPKTRAEILNITDESNLPSDLEELKDKHELLSSLFSYGEDD